MEYLFSVVILFALKHFNCLITTTKIDLIYLIINILTLSKKKLQMTSIISADIDIPLPTTESLKSSGTPYIDDCCQII